MKVGINLTQLHFLGLLLITDIVLLALHLISASVPGIPEQLFSITRDGSYPEMFQYLKEFWIGVIMMYLGIRGRVPIYLVWAVIFFYLMFDDALRIHEQVGGEVLSLRVRPWLGLSAAEAYHYGQVVYAGLVGAVILVSLAMAYALSSPEARAVTRVLFLGLVALGVVGVLLDFADGLLRDSGWSPALSFIEDGGETLLMTLIAWYAYTLAMLEWAATRAR